MGNLQWNQAGAMSIQLDDAGTVWKSGHVAAVLPLKAGGAVVAADTGGVWT